MHSSIRVKIFAAAISITLGCFALSPLIRGTPDPTSVNGTFNTADGDMALLFVNTGAENTALGFRALFNDFDGSDNTATGFQALVFNKGGNDNTAVGSNALMNNGSGSNNTATGFQALAHNTASNNTATGFDALLNNAGGTLNTANGYQTLGDNTSGSNNTADGANSLVFNTSGSRNTADGDAALENNTTGNNNVGLGYLAGQNLTTGSNNIDIGANVLGNAGEANTIRIGKSGTQQKTFIAGIYGKTVASGVGVIINTNGQLGTVQSSARFKDDIKPMDKASEAILVLKPVTFRYKREIDPDGIAQFGLIAEEVDKVNPDLVIRDEDGKIMSVRYEAVNAMLLNEFLKEHKAFVEEHRKVQEQEATIAQLKSGMEVLTANLKEQASQIQKVNQRLEQAIPLQVVDNE
jgi:hypothetical protein